MSNQSNMNDNTARFTEVFASKKGNHIVVKTITKDNKEYTGFVPVELMTTALAKAAMNKKNFIAQEKEA